MFSSIIVVFFARNCCFLFSQEIEMNKVSDNGGEIMRLPLFQHDRKQFKAIIIHPYTV